MVEKTFSLRYQKILGDPLPEPGAWARCLVYEPADEKTLALRGKLFVVATLFSPKSFDVNLAGKLVLDTLHESYYALLDGPPLQALEKALVNAHRRLVDFTYSSSGGGEVDFNIAAGALWGNVLYLAKLGSVAAYLLREGEIKVISPAEEAQVAVASGLVQGDDVIILGSAKFKEAFPPQNLRDNLERLDKVLEALPDKRNLVGLVLRLDLKEAPLSRGLIQFVHPVRESVFFGFGFARKLLFRLRHVAGGILRRREKPLFLGRRGLRTKPGPKSLLVLLIFLFLISAFLTLRKQQAVRVRKETTRLFEESQQSLRSARDLIDLNNERARQLLAAAEESVKKAKVLGASTPAGEILREIKEVRRELDKSAAASPHLLYDLAIQDKASSPQSLTGKGTVLFVDDPKGGSLFKLDVGSLPVKVERWGEGQLKKPYFIDYFDNTLYGLDENGFFRFSPDGAFEGSLFKVEGREAIADLRVYFGSFYLLTSSKNALLKYAVLEDGYAEGTAWLKEDIDLSSAVSLAIDGSVYLFFKEGRVLKFSLGKREEFALVGLPGPLSQHVLLYTNAGLSYLYLLDKEGSRVAVVSKEGIYQRQFTLNLEDEPLADLRSFWVNEVESRLYLLSGTKVYEVDLGQGL